MGQYGWTISWGASRFMSCIIRLLSFKRLPFLHNFLSHALYTYYPGFSLKNQDLSSYFDRLLFLKYLNLYKFILYETIPYIIVCVPIRFLKKFWC